MVSRIASTAIEAASPSEACSSVRRRRSESPIAAAINTRTSSGSAIASAFSSFTPLCACLSCFESRMTKFVGIVPGGTRSNSVMPRSCSRFSTRSSTGARAISTRPFVSRTSFPFPVRILFSCLCERLFSSTQSRWNWSEARKLIVAFWTKVCSAFAIAGAKTLARAGRTSCARAATSTFANSVLVTLAAMAAWMCGFEASGLTVRT